MLSSPKYSPQIDYSIYGIDSSNAKEASFLFLNNGNRKLFLGHNIFEEIFTTSKETVEIPFNHLTSVHIPGECRLLVGPSYNEENMVITPYSGVKIDYDSNIEVILGNEVQLLNPIFSIPAYEANILLKSIGSFQRIDDHEMALFSLFISTRCIVPHVPLDDNRVSYDLVCKSSTPRIVSVGKYVSDATNYYLLSYPIPEIIHELCDAIDCSQVDSTLGVERTYKEKNVLYRDNNLSHRPHYKLLQPLLPIKTQYQWAAIDPSFVIGTEVTLSFGSTWSLFDIKKLVDYPALTGDEDLKQFRWLHYAKVPFKLIYGYITDLIDPVPYYMYTRSPCLVHVTYEGGVLVEVAKTSTTTKYPMACVAGLSPKQERIGLSMYFPYENYANPSLKQILPYGKQYVVGSENPCIIKVSPLDISNVILDSEVDPSGTTIYCIRTGVSATYISPYVYAQGRCYLLSEIYYLTKVAQSLQIFEGGKRTTISYKVTHSQIDAYHAILWKHGIKSYYKLAIVNRYSRIKKSSRQVALFPTYKPLRSREVELSGLEVDHVVHHTGYRSVTYDILNLTIRNSPILVGTGSLNGRDIWRVFASVLSDNDYIRWLVRLRYLRSMLDHWNQTKLRGYSTYVITRYISHIYGWAVPSFIEDDSDDDDRMPDLESDSDNDQLEFAIDRAFEDEELDRREDIM